MKQFLTVGNKTYSYYPISTIEGSDSLPYALRVLLENVLRNASSEEQAQELANRIVKAGNAGEQGEEIEFSPARVLFQDLTGVPVFTDFASMREAFEQKGGDPQNINPHIPCDLVIDHSVIADEAGCASALQTNEDLEFSRNTERFEFLKWAQNSFEKVRIVPPGVGICHQLNIENFASVVHMLPEETEAPLVYFDTLVGTDSHTTTANGIGVLGWGVGGIEAEAAALGQPITTLVPKVIGIHVTGTLQPQVSAMDVALSFAQLLRARGAVGAYVECFGEGVENLSATQRACIANMTPEYGCTCTLFPVDEKVLEFLRLTGRSEDHLALVEAYARKQGMWNEPGDTGEHRTYAEVIEFNLSGVEPSLAGPSKPHDRIALSQAKKRFQEICTERNLVNNLAETIEIAGATYEVGQGTIAMAAVTSCTTATDPAMMVAAGMLAKRALEKGLRPKPWVKTVFAPGSHATETLLQQAGLLEALQSLGFYTCGFGCMTCIGNSGAIPEVLQPVKEKIELTSILSGNRNFEGRISPDIAQNYLAAPAVVVAYSLVGTMDFDPLNEPVGTDAQGNEVYLTDLLPTNDEVASVLQRYLQADLYTQAAQTLYTGSTSWENLHANTSDTFAWNESSTYVRRPPFVDEAECIASSKKLQGARVLAYLGDFITTDHISPAGSIAPDSAAAQYLESCGVTPDALHSYGARRGNHEVMMRGTFANVKLQNKLAAGKKAAWTKDFLSGETTLMFDAAMHYQQAGIPLIVLAGKMYGSGSSRDWAAKGQRLLGVRAVLAESFERIHRSNLIGMGIVPLQFKEGESAESLGLTGEEVFSFEGLNFDATHETQEAAFDALPQYVRVSAQTPQGETLSFEMVIRIDTPTELAYVRQGGILPYVLQQLLAN